MWYTTCNNIYTWHWCSGNGMVLEPSIFYSLLLNGCGFAAKKVFTLGQKRKGLVAVCHSFLHLFFSLQYSRYIHTIIHPSFINIRWGPSPYLHSCPLSGWNLPGVPSRDSNSGLPYSKPARYQLSHAAPQKRNEEVEQCGPLLLF